MNEDDNWQLESSNTSQCAIYGHEFVSNIVLQIKSFTCSATCVLMDTIKNSIVLLKQRALIDTVLNYFQMFLT